MNDDHTKLNDVDDVAKRNQQLLQQKTKTSIDVSHPIYQKINRYLSKKYPNTNLEFKDRRKETDYIFSLGVERAEKELECSILFEEKKPRRDVLENLGKMAHEFLIHHQYPEIQPMVVTKVINKVMGSRCDRTKEKYKKCITQYTKNSGELGNLDISLFVERIPKQYLPTTSSTSSFGEKI